MSGPQCPGFGSMQPQIRMLCRCSEMLENLVSFTLCPRVLIKNTTWVLNSLATICKEFIRRSEAMRSTSVPMFPAVCLRAPEAPSDHACFFQIPVPQRMSSEPHKPFAVPKSKPLRHRLSSFPCFLCSQACPDPLLAKVCPRLLSYRPLPSLPRIKPDSVYC